MQAGEVHVVPGRSAGGVRVLLAALSPPSSAPIARLSASLLWAGCGGGANHPGGKQPGMKNLS